MTTGREQSPAGRWDALDLLDNEIVIDDQGHLQYFAVEVVEQDAGQTRRVHKVISLYELAFIPIEARKDPDLLGKMHTVLRGCYDAQIDIMHIIAGMYDTDPPLGIMQFYGAMGAGESRKEALQRALLGTEGLIHTMANFPQIAFRPLDIPRTQWLRDAMFSMPYVLTVIGQPDPRNAARGGGRPTTQGAGEVTGAADNEVTSQQNEMLMRAMADAKQSFLMITLASRVRRDELATLLEGLARRASIVASQQRGTRGISFNLGVPVFLNGLVANAAAVTHTAGQAHGITNAVGSATGHAHTTSAGHFTADAQGQGVAVTQGSAVTHGSFSSSSVGVAVSNTSSVGHAHTAGQSWGTAHTTGVADTTSVSHTHGHSSSSSFTSGTTTTQINTTSNPNLQTHSTTHNSTLGVTNSHATTNVNTNTAGHTLSGSVTDMHGSQQSASVTAGKADTGAHSTSSQNTFSGSGQGKLELFGTGVDVTGGGAHSSGQADIQSHTASSQITMGGGVSQSRSTTAGIATQSQHTGGVNITGSRGIISSNSHGGSDSTTTGQTTTGGTNVATTSSSSHSSSSFSSVTRGRAHTVSRSDTVSHGRSVADTSSRGTGHGVTIVRSHSAGSSAAYTQSVATTRSRSRVHSEGSSTGTADTTSSSRSRVHGVSETTSINQGRSLGTATSTGIMAGLSPGVSVQKSFAFEDDVMTQLTQILRQQEELVRRMSLEGGYVTDVYLLTRAPEGQKVAEAAIPQAFHGLNDVVTPVQTRKLSEEEQQHIRAHIAAWSACATEEAILDGVNAYRHGTLLTLEQLAAYVSPGLFEEGTAATTMEKVPPLGFYPDLKGEVFLGHQISPETRKVTKAALRLSEDRMFHTLFAADTGFGKSVAAERLALETTLQWHYRTVVLDFGAGWRDMIHAPRVPPERMELWQLYPGSPRPLRWNPLQIGRRIDPDQQLRITPELLANAGRMGPKQLGFMQETLSALYRDNGVLTTDALVQEDPSWGTVRDADEEEAINARRRERGQNEEKFVGQPLRLLSADELQALAVHRSKQVDILDWYERLLLLEEELKKQRRSMDLTSLEGIKVRLKPFTYGNMARMYAKGDDTIAIEDVALPWGMCIFEGGAQLDTYAKAALLALMAWHLYTDAVARERQGDFYRMQIFFEEANKVLTGISSGVSDGGSPLQSISQQFEDMWRDGRKYGIFLHPIVQTPSELPPGIISSCNNVLFGQLKNPRDRDLAVAHLSFSEKGFADEDYRRWITRTEIGRATVRLGYTKEYGEMMPVYAAILKVPGRRATEADIARYFAGR
jgi:hypothetical protein